MAKLQRKHKDAIRQYVLLRAVRQQYNFEIVVDLTTKAAQMKPNVLHSQLEKAGFQFGDEGWQKLAQNRAG